MNQTFANICEKSRLVGASSVLLKDGKIIELMSYGFSSKEEGRITTPYTVYRIASVSKTVLALSLMCLVEQGKLSIEDDISKHLGFLVRNPNHPSTPITIKMMLTQTSSITDGKEEPETGYNQVNGTNRDVYLRDLLIPGASAYVDETFDSRPPGSTFIYANFNCGILACIIEKITGVLFTTYIKETIFKPLGLDASFIISDIINPDVASTYTHGEEGLHASRTREEFLKRMYKTFPLGENYRGPAGGLFINMVDLMRIAMVFINQGTPILKKETIDEMLKMHWQGPRDGSYQAKGLQMIILDDFGIRLWGHFGDAYGVKSYMLFNPERKIAMTFITNGGYYQYQPSGICDVHEQLIQKFLIDQTSSN